MSENDQSVCEWKTDNIYWWVNEAILRLSHVIFTIVKNLPNKRTCFGDFSLFKKTALSVYQRNNLISIFHRIFHKIPSFHLCNNETRLLLHFFSILFRDELQKQFCEIFKPSCHVSKTMYSANTEILYKIKSTVIILWLIPSKTREVNEPALMTFCNYLPSTAI